MIQQNVFHKQSILPLLLFFMSLSVFSQTGETLFKDDIIHEIRLYSPNTSIYSELHSNHNDYYANTISSPIYSKFKIEIDGNVLTDSVGMRMKGETSFLETFGEKKPFKIDINKFSPDQKYEGLKKFNLHNATYDASIIREKLCYDLHREVDVKAPRVSFAKVYLNDTYWGLYSIVEQVNKTFLKDNFGANDGNLYKAKSGGSIDLSNMDLKTNKTANDFSKLLLFKDKVINTPDNQFEDTLRKYLNVPRYLASLAVDVLVLDIDKYWQAGKNFYLYENQLTGKMEWIPWDYNLSMNYIMDGSSTDPDYKKLIDNPLFNNKVLIDRIMNNANLRAEYTEMLCQLQFAFNTTSLFDKIDDIQALIELDVQNDTKKDYSNNEFLGNIGFTDYLNLSLPNPVPGVKQFITDRSQTLQDFLSSNNLSCTSTLDISVNTLVEINVYPNPAQNQINIDVDTKSVQQLIIVDLSGREMDAIQVTTESTAVDLVNYPSGMYLIHGLDHSGRRLSSQRFIKR